MLGSLKLVGRIVLIVQQMSPTDLTFGGDMGLENGGCKIATLNIFLFEF